MALRYPGFGHMTAITDSVLASGAAGQLAGTTSVHDPIVVPAPVLEPSYDVIVVRAPSSLRRPLTRHVLIEHLSCTGHNDRIERPVSGAVPLFWRFVTVKYGIRSPARLGQATPLAETWWAR
jgi:hypothetical protein